jgi:protein required for attachment to host cells
MAIRRTVMGKTDTGGRNDAWFALVDAEHCRLLCCRLTERDTQHVDQYDVLENTFPEAERARPMTQDGMTHDVEERERRFAGAVVGWLQKRVEEHEIDHLVVFATPRLLGVLRKAPLGLLKGHVEELEGNLMRLEAGQLAEHPLVRKLVRATQEE